MKRFKRILLVWGEQVPTSALFPWCQRLATAADAEAIDGLWCVDRSLPDYPGLNLEVSSGTGDGGQELLDALTGLPTKVETHEGDPLRAVLERLTGGDYDLVVVSIHDSASRGMAERLARKSPVGVLALPPESVPPPRHIMVGLDFSDLSALCMNWAEAFATLNPEHDSELRGVHVMSVPSGAKETLTLDPEIMRREVERFAGELFEDFVKANAEDPSKWKREIVEGPSASDALLAKARREACDLLIVGCHGRNALSIALLGSHACEVIRRGDTALLVVKRKNENLGFLRELLGMPS